MEIFKNACAHFKLATELMENSMSDFMTAHGELAILTTLPGCPASTTEFAERQLGTLRLRTFFQWECVQRHIKYTSSVISGLLSGVQLRTDSLDLIQDALDTISVAEDLCCKTALKLSIF